MTDTIHLTTRNLGHSIVLTDSATDRIVGSGHASSAQNEFAALTQNFHSIRGLILHLDASDATSLTTIASGSVSTVSEWRNRNGLTQYRTLPSGGFAVNRPWLRTSPHLGVHEVYFQGRGQALSLGEQLDSAMLGPGKSFTIMMAVSLYEQPMRSAIGTIPTVELLSKYSNNFLYDLSFGIYATLYNWLGAPGFSEPIGGRATVYFDTIQDGDYGSAAGYAESHLDWPFKEAPQSLVLTAIYDSTLSNVGMATIYLHTHPITDDGAGQFSFRTKEGLLNSSMIDSTAPLVMGPWTTSSQPFAYHDLAIFTRKLTNIEILLGSTYMVMKNRMDILSSRNFRTMPLPISPGSTF